MSAPGVASTRRPGTSASNCRRTPSRRWTSCPIRTRPRTAGSARAWYGSKPAPGRAAWRATANSFVPMPCLTLCDGYSWGVRNYNPRVWFGGPIVKDKVFISQAVEYRLTHARIPSLPDPDNQQRSDSFDAFTRVDVHPAAGHALTATVAFFPRRSQNATLNTFNPQEVNPDLTSWGYNLALSESATLSPRSVLASFVSASLYDATVEAHNDRDMELTVDGNRGGYFNRPAATHARLPVVGGADAVPLVAGRRTPPQVRVRRAAIVVHGRERQPARRHSPGGRHGQLAGGLQRPDRAACGRDRCGGVRAGPVARESAAAVRARHPCGPRRRAGSHRGVAAPRHGDRRRRAGRRDPPRRRRTLHRTRAAQRRRVRVVRGLRRSRASQSDGTTPVGPPVTRVHRTLPLDTPRALVWNVEYAHRLGSSVFVKVSHLERSGSREFIVDPVATATGAELQLASAADRSSAKPRSRCGSGPPTTSRSPRATSGRTPPPTSTPTTSTSGRSGSRSSSRSSLDHAGRGPEPPDGRSHRAAGLKWSAGGAARGAGRVPVLAGQRGPGVRRRRGTPVAASRRSARWT